MKTYQSISVLFGAETISFVNCTIQYGGNEICRINMSVCPANFESLLKAEIDFNRQDDYYSILVKWDSILAMK